MSRSLALLLSTALALSSLIMVGSVYAQSVPEFTLKYVDYSYDVPPTYEIDQYTGEKVVTDYGHHVDNRTIEFTITNQPFTPYEDSDGNNISLYYNFRFKGPYGDAWSYYPDTSHMYGYYAFGPFPDTSASESDYTIIAVNLPTLTSYPEGTPDIPTGSDVEFQVQAIIGYVERSYTGLRGRDFYGFTGEISDWSETQTITIGESQAPSPEPTSSPEPTPTPFEEPQQIGQDVILGVAITVAVLGVGLGLLVYLIKRK